MQRRTFFQSLAAFFTGARLLKPRESKVIVDPEDLIIRPAGFQVPKPTVLVRLEFTDGYKIDINPLRLEYGLEQEIIDITDHLSDSYRSYISGVTTGDVEMSSYYTPTDDGPRRLFEAFVNREEFLTRVRFPTKGFGADLKTIMTGNTLQCRKYEPMSIDLSMRSMGDVQHVKIRPRAALIELAG